MARPVAFISGAAQGIGAAISLGFANAGYDLAVSSTKKDKLADVIASCTAAGARTVPVELNVTSQASIEAGPGGEGDAVVGKHGALGFVQQLALQFQALHAGHPPGGLGAQRPVGHVGGALAVDGGRCFH